MLEDKRYSASVAVSLLQQAAAVGNAEALYALGTWHLFGKHVKKNYRQAAVFLERAEQLDYSEAAYDLAVCYEKGAGVDRDTNKAFGLYMKAALLGDKQAKYEVGRCFYWGIGTSKDRDAANVWFDAYERGESPRLSIKRARIAQGWRSTEAA